MPHSIINSKFAALITAVLINAIACWAFAQLSCKFHIKAQRVYTVNIDSFFDSKPISDEKRYQTHIQKQKIYPKQSLSFNKSKEKQIIAKANKILSPANNTSNSLLQNLHNKALDVAKKEVDESISTPQRESVSNNMKLFCAQTSLNAPTPIERFPQIANWIEKHKFYPQQAIYKGQEGRVKLVFVIEKDGKLRQIKFLEKSQFDSLNEAALKILEDSSPLPQVLIANINLPVFTKINIIFKLE